MMVSQASYYNTRRPSFSQHSHLADNAPILPAIAAVFFVLTFVIKAFVDDPFTRGDVSSAVAYTKYLTAAVAVFAGLLFSMKNGERVFVSEFDKLVIVFLSFTLISIVCQFVSGIYSMVVLVELFKFVMPILLAYAMLNTIGAKGMYECMTVVLIASILGYLTTLAYEGVGISDVFQAELGSSESATESSTFSGIFLILTFYFAYFRKRKLWVILSAVFCFLTFKRLAMLFALVALVVCFATPKQMSRRIPHGVINVLKVVTIVTVAAWTWMLLPEQERLFMQIFSDTPSHFTQGRSDVLRYLLSTGYRSYGFGSASETAQTVFGASFEMDLTKIAIELTPFAMILFVWLYWDVAGTTLWGVFIIGYFMLNMITSDSLTSNFCLTLAYITCGLVEYGTPKAKD